MKRYENQEVRAIISMIKESYNDVKLSFGNIVHLQRDCIKILDNLEEKNIKLQNIEEKFKQKEVESFF
jgi:hypothetical protein